MIKDDKITGLISEISNKVKKVKSWLPAQISLTETKTANLNSVEPLDDAPLLSRSLFSQQVSKLICDNHALDDESSFIFGLSGKWGTGKTHFLNELKSDLQSNDGFIVIDISPWKYGSENLTFLRNFLKTLNTRADEERSRHSKLLKRLHYWLRPLKLPETLDKDVTTIKFNLWYIAVIFICLAVWLMYQIWTPEDVVTIINTDFRIKHIKEGAIGLATLILIPLTASLITLQDKSKALSTLDEFNQLLDRVLKKFPSDLKTVIFVDDLDRVSPEVSRSVLDTLRTFFDKPQLSFVVTGDHTVLEGHIGSQILASASKPEQIEEGRRYLKKIFNVYWQLPAQNDEEFEGFLNNHFDEKPALQSLVFTKKSEQLQTFKKWLLHYFEKNYRNVKRFVDTVIFNFEVIDQQFKKADSKRKAQLKDLKSNPLLVIRMLMIQEFSAPLFDDYIRDPAMVGQIEHDISSKNGELLTQSIKRLTDAKLLSPSQEIFLKKFMFEVPRFYDPQNGGNMVRSIDPFLYLAASSDFSDVRGPTGEDFLKMLDNTNVDQMVTAIQNSGPSSLKEIIKHTLKQMGTLDSDPLQSQLTLVLSALRSIDGDHASQGFFKDALSKVDISTLLLPTRPLTDRFQIIKDFWKWLDSLASHDDFDHYYNKFALTDPAGADVIIEVAEKLAEFGHFSGRMILKWFIFNFSNVSQGQTIQQLHTLKDRLPQNIFDELISISDELIAFVIGHIGTKEAQQLWDVFVKVSLPKLNADFDSKLAEELQQGNLPVSEWVADNFDQLEKNTGSAGVLFETTKLIKENVSDPVKFKSLLDIHQKLFAKFKDDIWKEVLNLDRDTIDSFIKMIQGNNFTLIEPNSDDSQKLINLILTNAATKSTDHEEAEVLVMLKKTWFWANLEKITFRAKLAPKRNANSKPEVQRVAEEVLNSWKA